MCEFPGRIAYRLTPLKFIIRRGPHSSLLRRRKARIFRFAFGVAQSVHVTVVDGHGEENKDCGQCGIDGNREPAPGGSAREVSGGVSGRNLIAAPGTSVPADRLAAADTGRRRSLGTRSRPGAGDRARCARAQSRRETSSPWTASPSRLASGRNRRQQDSRLPLTLISAGRNLPSAIQEDCMKYH